MAKRNTSYFFFLLLEPTPEVGRWTSQFPGVILSPPTVEVRHHPRGVAGALFRSVIQHFVTPVV